MVSFYRVENKYGAEIDFYVLRSAVEYALSNMEDEPELYKVHSHVQQDDAIAWVYKTLATCPEDFETLYNVITDNEWVGQ